MFVFPGGRYKKCLFCTSHDGIAKRSGSRQAVSLAERLSAELLNLIGEGIASDEDVLRPRHLGSLASSCKAIKAAVKDALDQLQGEVLAARNLLSRKFGISHPELETLRESWWYQQMLRNIHLGIHFKSHNCVVAADAPALHNVLKSEAMQHLETLDLHRDKLGDEGAVAIAAAAAGGGMARLKGLYLYDCGFGGAGAKALASALDGGAFRQLQVLTIVENPDIGESGAIALASALENGALPALRQLILAENNGGTNALMALVKAFGGGRLPLLHRVTLQDTGVRWETLPPVGVEAIQALAGAVENGDLPSLDELNVDNEHEDHPRLRAACEARGFRPNHGPNEPPSDQEVTHWQDAAGNVWWAPVVV